MSAENELLIEIGCEEIPSSYIEPAMKNMAEAFGRFCEDERIETGGVATYATPRRLTLIARNIAEKQKDIETEVKGPPAKIARGDGGEWSPVAEKFAASRGVDTSDLSIKDTPKGEYVFALIRDDGKPVRDVIPALMPKLLASMHFPKSMRWDTRPLRFARPVRWLLFLLGGRPVRVDIEGIPCGNVTYGNRYYGGDPIEINSADEYFSKLEAAGVMADHNKRKDFIRDEVNRLADGVPHMTDELLEEVSYLVEYPYIGVGEFPEEFTQLPKEVLTICIEKNQHYFPIFDRGTGGVLPRFVNVMNAPLTENKTVIKGYEKVLISRLKDAQFFYEEDLKTPLPDRVEKLNRIKFQQKLGDLSEKTDRVKRFVEELGMECGAGGGEIETARRAAKLMKADLTTQMVFEYTEIQGTVGKYYALKAGEEEAVAQAIEDHYMPRYAGGELPHTLPGALVAVADKMDTMAGFFSIGLQPTGSADPFQLRRQALGVIRILEDRRFGISLPRLIGIAASQYGSEIIPGAKRDELAGELLDFFKGRFEGFMQSLDFDYDVVNAVNLANVPSLHHAVLLAKALASIRHTEEFRAMHEVYTRVSNIQKKSAKSDDFKTGEIDTDRFEEASEKELYEAFKSVSQKIEESDLEAYGERVEALYALTPAAHSFFDNVLVMAEDDMVRANRLALLKQIKDLYERVADFHEIVITGD